VSILKNVLIILRGSLAAQAISFATLPLLARLYTPEVFGRYQIFLLVLSFLVLSASLRYEVPILNADTDSRAFSLAKLCLIINVGTSALTLAACGALYFLAPELIAKLGATLWLLPAALLAGGVFQTVTYLLLRSHALRETASAKAVQALGYSAIAAGLGSLRVTNFGLVIADVAAKVLAVGFVLNRMVREDDRYRLWRKQEHAYRPLLARYRDYPLVSLPGSLLNNLGGTLTPLLLFGLFGAATAGQYALVERCLAMPVAVIGQAASQAYLASFSASLRSSPADTVDLFRKVLATLLKVGVLPAIVIMIFGREIFELVFGSTWSTAGRFAQSMAPMLLAAFLVGPVDMSLQMLNKQRLNFLWHLLRLILVAGGWTAVAVYQLSAVTAVKLYAGVSIVAYLTLLFLIHRNVVGDMSLRSARR